MNSDLMILLKGLCTGFFYTFLLIMGIITVSHYTVRENPGKGIVSALGIIIGQTIWAAIAMVLIFFTYKGVDADSKILPLIGSMLLFIMAIRIYRSKQSYNIEPRLKTLSRSIFLATFLRSISCPFRALGYGSIFLVLNIHPHDPTLVQTILPVIGAFLGMVIFWTIFIFAAHHSNKLLPTKALQHFHQFAAFVLVAFSLIGLLEIYF